MDKSRDRSSNRTRSGQQGGTVIITGGRYQGRKLATPGGSTHPMGERERLALFNMLNGIINIDADTYVLDAFAGGGTLGFEAISRGARDVIFMDKSRQACATISRNAKMLGLDKGAFCMDVDDFLDMTTDRFDLIFLDPPYDNYDPGYIDDFRSVLMWGGIMVVSHPGEQPTEVDGLTILKSRKYARAMITIYQRNEDDPDGEMMDEGLYWARREKNDERGYLGL